MSGSTASSGVPSLEDSNVRLVFGEAKYVLPKYAVELFAMVKDMSSTLPGEGEFFDIPIKDYSKESFEILRDFLKSIEGSDTLKELCNGQTIRKDGLAEQLEKNYHDQHKLLIETANLIDYLNCQAMISFFSRVIVCMITNYKSREIAELFGYKPHTAESLAEYGITPDEAGL